MLLVAIALCVWLTKRRWVARGGEADLVYEVALWGVLAGIVGARLYHDLTSWNEDQLLGADPGRIRGGARSPSGRAGSASGAGSSSASRRRDRRPPRAPRPGAAARGGARADPRRRRAAGARRADRRGQALGIRDMLDAAAPGLLLAQGVGRWGNYWNQELFGKATRLPWALKIDYDHCPDSDKDLGNQSCNLTYHPTFLYEFVWDLAGVGAAALARPEVQVPRAGALRALRRATTPSGASSRSCCASTRPITSSGCA